MKDLIVNVTGISALLAGMTVLSRIPRLTRSTAWILFALLFFALGAALYGWLVTADVHTWHAMEIFGPAKNPPPLAGRDSACLVIFLSALIAGFAAWGSRQPVRTAAIWRKSPFSWIRPLLVGARPLIYPAGAYVLLIIGYRVREAIAGNERSLWPLLLASGAFLYLWWLATLLFDLVFVWHRYIRHSVANDYLSGLRQQRKTDLKEKTAPSPSENP